MSVIYDNAKLRKNCKSKPAAAKNLALKRNLIFTIVYFVFTSGNIIS